jgi:hypothetical protein
MATEPQLLAAGPSFSAAKGQSELVRRSMMIRRILIVTAARDRVRAEHRWSSLSPIVTIELG